MLLTLPKGPGGRPAACDDRAGLRLGTRRASLHLHSTPSCARSACLESLEGKATAPCEQQAAAGELGHGARVSIPADPLHQVSIIGFGFDRSMPPPRQQASARMRGVIM